MPSLRAEVEDALDSCPTEMGVLVTDAEGRLLGEREPSEGAGTVIVVVGVEPQDMPWRPR